MSNAPGILVFHCPLQHFEITGKVGEGTYGVVYLARPHANRSKLLAIKTFKPGKVGRPRTDQATFRRTWDCFRE